jgi:hypothetical protein
MDLPKQSPEREPADSLRDNTKVIGGWLPSLACAVDMMHSFVLLPCLVAVLATGCAIACGPLRSPPPQKLKVDALSPAAYRIRVVDFAASYETQVPENGQVSFDVPVVSRHCTQYFLGIKVHSATPVEKRRVIQIVKGDNVVRKLSADDIAKLPIDPDGYHILEAEK